MKTKKVLSQFYNQKKTWKENECKTPIDIKNIFYDKIVFCIFV